MTPHNSQAEGLIVSTQIPLDGKTYFKTLQEMRELGSLNARAFMYYKMMMVVCAETNQIYFWDEAHLKPSPGVLATNFVYPENSICFGLDYSEKAYNFFPSGIYLGEDKIIHIDEIIREEYTFTVPEGAVCQISGNHYTSSAPFIFTITPEEEGFKRYYILVAKISNVLESAQGELIFELVQGELSNDEVAFRPVVQPGSVYINYYYVNGENISHGYPTTGGVYITKASKATIEDEEEGAVENLNHDERTVFELKRSTSINGIKEESLAPEDDGFYENQKYAFHNLREDQADITLKHMAITGSVKFNFPDGKDFRLKYKHIREFLYNPKTKTLDFVGPLDLSSPTVSDESKKSFVKLYADDTNDVSYKIHGWLEGATITRISTGFRLSKSNAFEMDSILPENEFPFQKVHISIYRVGNNFDEEYIGEWQLKNVNSTNYIDIIYSAPASGVMPISLPPPGIYSLKINQY